MGKLDIDWLSGRADDHETLGKLREIVRWQEEIITANRFVEGDIPFLLRLGGVTLRFIPFSAVASLEVYQEIFKDNDHRILPDFLGEEAEVIIDVGANQGMYALCLKQSNPTCHLYCFEPNPIEYATLVENLKLNGIQGVSAFPLAIGNFNGTIDFEYLPAVGAISGRGIRTVNRGWMKEEFISSTTVEQITLDTFSSRHGLGQIDILKIDAEGMEADVLAGSQSTLLNTSRVVIERHGQESRDSVVRILEEASFELLHEEDEAFSRYYGDLYFRREARREERIS